MNEVISNNNNNSEIPTNFMRFFFFVTVKKTAYKLYETIVIVFNLTYTFFIIYIRYGYVRDGLMTSRRLMFSVFSQK